LFLRPPSLFPFSLSFLGLPMRGVYCGVRLKYLDGRFFFFFFFFFSPHDFTFQILGAWKRVLSLEEKGKVVFVDGRRIWTLS